MFGCHLCPSGFGLVFLCYCYSCDLFKLVEQNYLLLHVSRTGVEVVWVRTAMLTLSKKGFCINVPLPPHFITSTFISGSITASFFLFVYIGVICRNITHLKNHSVLWPLMGFDNTVHPRSGALNYSKFNVLLFLAWQGFVPWTHSDLISNPILSS